MEKSLNQRYSSEEIETISGNLYSMCDGIIVNCSDCIDKAYEYLTPFIEKYFNKVYQAKCKSISELSDVIAFVSYLQTKAIPDYLLSLNS